MPFLYTKHSFISKYAQTNISNYSPLTYTLATAWLRNWSYSDVFCFQKFLRLNADTHILWGPVSCLRTVSEIHFKN